MESTLKRTKIERGTSKSLSTRARIPPHLKSGELNTQYAATAGGKPLPYIRGLHNSPGPDLDTDALNLPLVSLRVTSGSLKKHDEVARACAGRQVVKRFSNPEAFRSNARVTSAAATNASISRREIIERRFENVDGRLAQTLQHHWKPSAAIENERMRNSYLDSRPQTLPSIGRKSKNFAVDNSSGFPPLENRRISRQDILNRRTSFEAPKTPVQVAIRKKSNSLLEPPSRIIINAERKDDTRRIEGFTKSSSAYLKNATTSTCNTGKRREGSLDRREGARSVADFLTVSNRLRDITRGIVPRPSTLPKIIHTSKNLTSESHYNIGFKQPRESASREAPIYGKIRRRKLSLPAISRESILRKSTGSLQYYREFDTDSVDEEIPIRSYPRNLTPRGSEMKLDCKKISGTILRKSSSSKLSPTVCQDVKSDKSLINLSGDKKNKDVIRDLRAVSRRRIISSVEESKEKKNVVHHKLKRTKDKDYAMTEFASGVRQTHSPQESAVTKRSVNDSENKVVGGIKNPKNSNLKVSTWHNVKSRTNDSVSQQRNKTEQKTNPSSKQQTHVSTTLPLYMKSVRKTSSCTSSSIPLKIASRSTENRQSDTKTSRLSSKLIKEHANAANKSVNTHSRSLSDINSTRSISPATTSSIFGFCTGRRKVPVAVKKKNDSIADKSSVECVATLSGNLKLTKVRII